MNQIQELIRGYEREIEVLLETKRKCKPDSFLFPMVEAAVLKNQQFIMDLRGLL